MILLVQGDYFLNEKKALWTKKTVFEKYLRVQYFNNGLAISDKKYDK